MRIPIIPEQERPCTADPELENFLSEYTYSEETEKERLTQCIDAHTASNCVLE